jgi:c-di-GMP-binding flagellar brake protein YcgR
MISTQRSAELFLESDDTFDLENGVKVNEPVQVRASDDPNAVGYYSRVNDIVDGKHVIAWPTHNGLRLPVHRDQVVDLSFVRQDAAYAFACLVDEITFEPLPQITVIPCGPISKLERRQSFRVKCMVPVEIIGAITKGTNNLKGEPDRAISITTTIFDLSGGGMAFRHCASTPENYLVEVKLSLPDHGNVIKVPCRVVYSNQVPGKNLLYHIGICFLSISEAERGIFRYLFRIQLKTLRSQDFSGGHKEECSHK